jgi:uncharacterized protein YciI
MIVTALLFLWLSPAAPQTDAGLAAEGPPAVIGQEKAAQSSVQKLAASLTKYYVGHFTMGPNWSAEPGPKVIEGRKKGREVLAAHVKDGKIVGVAEATGKSGASMIVFFKTTTEAEAWTVINEFPGVKSGFYKGKLFEVWGTKGLGEKMQETLKPAEAPATKPFYLAVTTKGKKWQSKPSNEQLKHVEAGAENLLKSMESGKLKFYAAFTGSGDPRGIAIFEAGSMEEAQKMAKSGPLMNSKWLSVAVTECSVVDGTFP